jgi:hypothetical protein
LGGVLGAALLLCAGSVHAQMAIEISKDGHAWAAPGFAPPMGWVTRGSGVPFGTQPDLTVQIRRQVGGLAIADVNGDGRNDLIAVCYISQSFPAYEEWQDMIFYGNASGIETTPGWISGIETHTGDVQVGDLNNDGLPDIVTIHGGGLRRDTVRVYTGQPGGPSTTASYTSNTVATGWGTAGVLADIDQDGFDDLVTTNQGLSPDPFRPMLMFRNNAGTLSSAAVWQSAELSIQNGIDAADLNGDGFPDLGVAKWVNFASAIYLNNAGTLSTTPAATVGTTGTDRGAVFADFDGDGSLELAVGGSPTRIYEYSEGLLAPVAQTNPPFSGPQEIRAFDVNGDGWPDLGEVHFSDGRAHIYLNRDGVLDTTPSWTYDAPEVGTAMALGDLNGDGLPDLVVGYSGNTCIRVFFAIPQGCAADLDDNGVLNFFDLSAYLDLFNTQDPAADLASPFGVFNFFDLSAYLDLYNAGCP